jgi:hypothetical protein
MSVTSNAIKDPVGNFITTNWDAFNGEKLVGGDGAESCEVNLFYAVKPVTTGYFVIKGSTGKGYGHAEMHALHQLLVEIGVAAFDNYDVRIDCTKKPCCARCSVVLGFLGVKVANGATKKSNKCMGSTQWGVSMKVRELIKAKGGEKDFDAFCNYHNSFVNTYL